MSIDYCQLSPSLPPSSSPVHSGPPVASVTSDHHHYSAYRVLQPEATSQQQRQQQQQYRTMTNNERVSGDHSSAASRAPGAPPRPPKPLPPPRHFPPASQLNATTTTQAQNPLPPAPELPPKPATTINNSDPSKSTSTPPTLDTTGSISHASTSGFNTPPAQKWTRSFANLIQDKEGLALFRQFLTQESGSEDLTDLIDFHFSCESIRCPENAPHIPRLARAIIRRYVLNNRTVRANLSDEVKEQLIAVYKKLNESKSKESEDADANNNFNYTDTFYKNLFNDAQSEIHNKLSGSFYEHFIRHDIYLRHLSENTFSYSNSEQAIVYFEAPNAEATPSPSNGSLVDDGGSGHGQQQLEALEVTASHLPSLPPPSYQSTQPGYDPYRMNDGFRQNFDPTKPMPTLPEQDETSSNIDLKVDEEVASAFAPSDKATIGSSDYIAYYSSADSGISSTFTDLSRNLNAMSLERLRRYPPQPPLQRPARTQSPIVGPSSATLGRHMRSTASTGGSSSFVGDGIKYEGSINPDMMQSYYNSKIQMQRGLPPPNPYHINTFTVVQPSTRDSEVNSISSNSTSESISRINFHADRQQRTTRPTVGGGGGSSASSGRSSSNNPNLQPNALRSALIGLKNNGGKEADSSTKVPDPTTDPVGFVTVLVEKLNAEIEKIAVHHKITQKVRDIEKESDSSSSTADQSQLAKAPVKRNFCQGLKDALKSKQFDFGPPDKEDKNCQEILDKHCAQVFDKTPSNSGTPTTQVPGQGQVPAAAAGIQQVSGAQYLVDGPPHPQQRYYPQGSYQPRGPSSGHHQPSPQPPYNLQPAAYPSRTHLPPSPNPLTNAQQSFSYPLGPPLASASISAAASHSSIPVTVKFSDEDCPYKLTMAAPATLYAFKQIIPKRGKAFQYFFRRKCTAGEKKESQTEYMQELIQDDNAILPLCDGKILATAHQL